MATAFLLYMIMFLLRRTSFDCKRGPICKPLNTSLLVYNIYSWLLGPDLTCSKYRDAESSIHQHSATKRHMPIHV